MRNFIQNIIAEKIDDYKKIDRKLREIVDHLGAECNYTNTTSLNDCRFLCYLTLKYKPKKILEIGTWVGSTSYSIALANEECEIHTIDNNDKFINLENNISKRIFRYSNIFSYDFLPTCKLDNIDMIFNDANISLNDCENIYKMANSQFIFATHDYYNSSGGYEKGYDAIDAMKQILQKYNAKYTEYIPEKSWYFENEFGVNACCGLLLCEKK